MEIMMIVLTLGELVADTANALYGGNVAQDDQPRRRSDQPLKSPRWTKIPDSAVRLSD